MDAGAILIAIWAMAVLSLLWFLVCNQITYIQRGRIIERGLRQSIGTPDFDRILVAFDRVSYGEHLLRLFTFRRAVDLYDPELVQRCRPDKAA